MHLVIKSSSNVLPVAAAAVAVGWDSRSSGFDEKGESPEDYVSFVVAAAAAAVGGVVADCASREVSVCSENRLPVAAADQWLAAVAAAAHYQMDGHQLHWYAVPISSALVAAWDHRTTLPVPD